MKTGRGKPGPKTIHLAAWAYSSDEDYNSECDVASLLLDQRTAQLALDRIALAGRLHEKNSDFSELRYFNYAVQFFPMAGVFEEFNDKGEGDFVDWMGEPPIEDSSSTEVNEMVTDRFGVQWEALARHTNIVVSTPRLEKKELQALLAKLEGTSYAAV